MTAVVGKDGKVTLGAATVVGMGTWSYDGVSIEEFDKSGFGDSWKTFLYGMKDGGSVVFSGHYDPTDTNGQAELQLANLYITPLADIRFYFNSGGYYRPCPASGYFSPELTTGAPTIKGGMVVTSVVVNSDKSGLIAVSFTGRVSGSMAVCEDAKLWYNYVYDESWTDYEIPWGNYDQTWA